MKVLFILGSKQLGGAEIQALYLCKELSKTYDLSLLVIGKPGPLCKTLDFSTITFTESSGNIFCEMRLLYRFIRSFRPEAIVNFLYRADVVGSGLGTMLKVPLIVNSARNMRWSKYRRWKVVFLSFVAKYFSDAVVANSLGARDFHVSHGFPKDKVRVIPNFPTYNLCRETKVNEYSGLIRLGIASRAVPGKGHNLLLRLLERYSSEYPNLSLHFIGPGITEWSWLKDRLNVSGLGNRVGLSQFAPNLESWLHNIDIYVLGSDWEGDSNMLLECLLHRVPVLVSSALEVDSQFSNLRRFEADNLESLLDNVLSISDLSIDERNSWTEGLRNQVLKSRDSEVIRQDWVRILSSLQQ